MAITAADEQMTGTRCTPVLANIKVARLVAKPVEVADKLVANEGLPASGEANLRVDVHLGTQQVLADLINQSTPG